MKRTIAVLIIMMVALTGAFAASRTYSYDGAVEEAGWSIMDASEGKVISVLPFEGDNEAVGHAFSDAVETWLSKNGAELAERKTLDKIMEELEFQADGMVDDDLAVSIGHMAGAELLLTGNGTEKTSSYDFDLKLVDVEAGTVVWSDSLSIRYDRKLENLMEKDATKKGTQMFGVGVRGGAMLSLSKGHPDMTDGGPNVTDHMGYAGNAAFSLAVRPVSHFAIQIEADAMINNSLHSTGTLVQDNKIYTMDMDFSYNSIDVPLMLVGEIIYSPVTVSAYAGAYMSFPISRLAMKGQMYQVPVDQAEKTELFNYGVLGGLNIEIPAGPGGIAIDCRYIHDLAPLMFTMLDPDTGLMETYGALYRSGVVASVGYTFHL